MKDIEKRVCEYIFQNEFCSFSKLNENFNDLKRIIYKLEEEELIFWNSDVGELYRVYFVKKLD